MARAAGATPVCYLACVEGQTTEYLVVPWAQLLPPVALIPITAALFALLASRRGPTLTHRTL